MHRLRHTGCLQVVLCRRDPLGIGRPLFSQLEHLFRHLGRLFRPAEVG